MLLTNKSNLKNGSIRFAYFAFKTGESKKLEFFQKSASQAALFNLLFITFSFRPSTKFYQNVCGLNTKQTRAKIILTGGQTYLKLS